MCLLLTLYYFVFVRHGSICIFPAVLEQKNEEEEEVVLAVNIIIIIITWRLVAMERGCAIGVYLKAYRRQWLYKAFSGMAYVIF